MNESSLFIRRSLGEGGQTKMVCPACCGRGSGKKHVDKKLAKVVPPVNAYRVPELIPALRIMEQGKEPDYLNVGPRLCRQPGSDLVYPGPVGDPVDPEDRKPILIYHGFDDSLFIHGRYIASSRT